MRRSRVVIGASFALLGALFVPRATLAEDRVPIARAVSVQGTVEWQRLGQNDWQPVKLNDSFAAGDKIRVAQRSRADLSLLDRTVLRLNENTAMTLQAVKGQSTGVVDLLRGAIHFFSRGPKSLEVNTPFTTAGVRGTEFVVEVQPEVAYVTVLEGTVVASNDLGSVTLTDGQSAAAEPGKPPVLRLVAHPRDGVAWALYYPPVLHFRPEEFQPGSDWQGKMRASLDAYRQGDLKRAFEGIADVPADVSDPRFFTYRPHLLLAVGRADEAAADIQRALALAPENADALALQTVVAIVQNDRDHALEIAQRAVRTAPSSATAYVALSYAQQARFDLEGARESVQRAVELDPKNALAWARLAELHSSFGNLTLSLRAAERAAALEPNLSRTQTVLGFSRLTLVQLPQARESFEKAIALDSADPLPRLGLGLAKIRANELSGGARDIESAASLDPNNALIRSYLGKAYYEEKRTELKEREYEAAQQLDPLDPTPWFYAAIAKQTTNRPVEALHDLEKAVALNDNRAVYRSRLMLDSDLAARSVSLARIYSDLGFQQLALVEGWKSVNTDPTNFSAHRFLADSYSALPRHEIARVSELLQAQLLQPLNTTPIQPSLAESNLFLVSSAGPGGLSFNELNPIFNRDRAVVQPGGLAGSNGLYAGETVAAAVQGNASLSVGYSRFQTDGFRVNADQKDDIANAFGQYEIGDSTSVQAEYRYRKNERGDLNTRFFADDYFPALRITDETHTFRVGGRQTFSPSSIALASFTYRTLTEPQRDDAPPSSNLGFVDYRARRNAFSGELQHLLASRYANVTSGVGYFDVSGHTDVSWESIEAPPPFGNGTQLKSASYKGDRQHLDAYAYAYLKPVRHVTFTVGASYDRVTGPSETVPHGKVEQLNPKLGITWNPLPSTSLRAAAFRTLKRTLITDQTLEPTQAAGFNQFFDDFNTTDAWRFGGALDHKFSGTIFAGAEYATRRLKTPLIDLGDPANVVTRRIDWNEDAARGYLLATPLSWLAARVEYQYERFSTDTGELPDLPVAATTHRVPLGLSAFHRSGFGAAALATYFNQEGRFRRLASGAVAPGDTEFWVFDLAATYRLPRRLGFVAVGAKNLLDRQFDYFNTDAKNLVVQPGRSVFARLALAFP